MRFQVIFTTLLAAASFNVAFAKQTLFCDVAILGGGAAGVHTAFRLAPTMGTRVCVIEKENRLGGRIYDTSLTPDGPVFGLGALRIMETQEVVFKLADELGIKYVAAPYNDDQIRARGEAANDSETLRAKAYPKVGQTEASMYDEILYGAARAKASQYPDMRTFLRATFGPEGHQFMSDMFRFRGDFTYPVSAKGYMEFLDEDWNVCCTASFPVGGMSEFIKRMFNRASSMGARFYLSQAVESIDDGNGNSRYRVTTSDYYIFASRIVVAIDANAFKNISGTLATRIQAQQQFQDLMPIRVASINQWWPTAWWENAFAGKETRRVWSTESCVNHIEIPTTPYAAQQKVTRSVYSDEKSCVDLWEDLAKRGTAAVEAEIERGLKVMIPGVEIPKPLKTDVKIWPNGWYFLRAGSTYSNMDIARWAIQPLENEAVSLVGESYNPQRSTWSDGAYKSSINMLNAVFGMSLPGATVSYQGPIYQPRANTSRVDGAKQSSAVR